MTASIEMNRTLLASRDAIRFAVERCNTPSSSTDKAALLTTMEGAAVATGLLDVASYCEGLLVRVAIPKRDWERLILETASVLAAGQAPSTNSDPATVASIEAKKAELKAQLDRGGTTFYRIGIIRSIVLHVAQQGQPPTPYLLVDLGDAQETVALKQVCERVDDCTEEELLLLQRLMVIHKVPFLGMERHALLRRRLQALTDNGSLPATTAPGFVPAGAFYSPPSSSSGQRQRQLPAEGHADGLRATTLLLQQQREVIAQLQQDVEKKNHELYLMSLRMREQQQASDAEVKAAQAQTAALAEVNAAQAKAAQDKDAKIRPLLDTVKALHPLLKLAREKLSLPHGSLEDVERALREATVTPRCAMPSSAS